MTDKRFTIKDFNIYEDGDKIGMNLKDACNRLNELYELGKMQYDMENKRHLQLLSVFQRYAQKYERNSIEHKLIMDMASELRLPTTILGDINNRGEDHD